MEAGLKEECVKITDFGPFKVSTQRSFRNQEIESGASFSCSISDWNPDWPTFIETSWQYEMIITPGEATANATMNMYATPYVNAGSVVATFAANVLFTLNKPKLTVDGIDWYEATANNKTGQFKYQKSLLLEMFQSCQIIRNLLTRLFIKILLLH